MGAALVELNQKNFQLSRNKIESLPYKNRSIIKVLERLQQEKLTKLREDTLGILFEKLIREQEKKNLGQFYTPQEIVSYIFNYLKIKPNSTILDPTCGCGVFLVSAYKCIKKINSKPLQNIYGVDLNDSAAKIARINLWLRNGKNAGSLRVLEKNIKVGNSIIENKLIDKKAFNWKKEFSDIHKNGGFHFIVGNPPYVTLKNKRDYDVRESIFSKIANGSTNAASLVLARSFELLRDGGIMAFVLPKTLIRVNSYSRLRDFLLENSKVIHIYDLGNFFKGVRGEQVILFIQKTRNQNEIDQNKVLVKVLEKTSASLDNKKSFYIPQKVFKKHRTFLILENKRYYDIIEKIKGENLEDIAAIFRGLSISPKSDLISNTKTRYNKEIIKGSDVSKFSYKNGFFINRYKLRNNTSKTSLLSKEKIILQNIFSSEAGIISCIDKHGHLNFDTITNIVLSDTSYNIEYLFGLLNSKLINFYLKYIIYNRSKLTMHTDKVYIGKIPIKKIDKISQKEVVKLIKKLDRSVDKKKFLREIDQVVYKLYKINRKEQQMIDSALRKTMSKKSLW